LTAAAIVRAADLHCVSKFYYFVNGERKWAAYQAAFKTLTSSVDGHMRAAIAWPDWAITTKVDARGVWQHVWRAVQCHKTQMSIYKNIASLTEDDQKVIWGTGEFYRVYSLVHGGRQVEHDLFVGLR
jgi:LmbE family N-acetylglucosaminyl deacetylase